jgi:hypothetical protein
MINNKDGPLISDIRWTVDGRKLCIVFEEGLVIVGNV